MIKQRKGEYYNIFPLLYYADGVYRYFLINKSDRDKFKVGDYIIFKSDGNGATLDNKKYKILEFEDKNIGFLGGNESSGLYFKIKTDSTSFNPSSVQQYAMTGTGANDTSDSVFCNQGSKFPIVSGSEFTCTENPIFYGSSNYGSSLAIAGSWAYNFSLGGRS